MKYRKDFVTNSSSSCFICSTSMDASEVEEGLQELLAFYNRFTDNNLQFDQVFETPYRYTADMLPPPGDRYYHWGYENESNVGKIIVMSANDNSVPYGMWEFIMEKFNAERYHLG